MGESDSGYEFGSGEDELARLEVQGKALAPATRVIFAAAGIRAGMRGRHPRPGARRLFRRDRRAADPDVRS